MSSYKLNLKPGGIIPPDINIGVTLRKVPPVAKAATVATPAVVVVPPAITGPFYLDNFNGGDEILSHVADTEQTYTSFEYYGSAYINQLFCQGNGFVTIGYPDYGFVYLNTPPAVADYRIDAVLRMGIDGDPGGYTGSFGQHAWVAAAFIAAHFDATSVSSVGKGYTADLYARDDGLFITHLYRGDGGSQPIVGSNYTTKNADVVTFSLIVKGSNVRVLVDEIEMISFDDPSPIAGGTILFGINNNQFFGADPTAPTFVEFHQLEATELSP